MGGGGNRKKLAIKKKEKTPKIAILAIYNYHKSRKIQSLFTRRTSDIIRFLNP